MTTPRKQRLDSVRVTGMSRVRRLLIHPVFIFASLIAPALASDAIANQAKPTLAELLDGTILHKKVSDILKGEIVTVAAPETTRREMAEIELGERRGDLLARGAIEEIFVEALVMMTQRFDGLGGRDG
ncbi:MAG: hypothetical protein IH881_17360 [Myxococcales bacterium]|nr:hypothetical protein [Myxococcales bacterium]